jgi:hypothetical protein
LGWCLSGFSSGFLFGGWGGGAGGGGLARGGARRVKSDPDDRPHSVFRFGA